MKKSRRINPDTVVLLKQFAIGVAVMLAVALLVTAIWYGTRVQFLTIKEVSVEGGQTINTKQIEEDVKKILEGNYLGLVPRKFSWFYPKSEALEIVSSVERVHNIKIEILKNTEIKVTFDEFIPESLWCQSVASDDCLFLDHNGYAFGHAPKLSGGTFIRFVTTDRDIVVGEEVTNREIFYNAFRLSDLLEENGFFISHIELDKANDMFVGIVGGGELKSVATEDAVSIVDNLRVVLSSKEFSHLEPGNFRYIDLRFGSKVFVNEEIAVPDEEAAIASSSDETRVINQ